MLSTEEMRSSGVDADSSTFGLKAIKKCCKLTMEAEDYLIEACEPGIQPNARERSSSRASFNSI